MSADKSIAFSAREMEVLALAWQCMEQQPKIDMDKLASLAGYTRGSASVIFGTIKRKIKLLGEGLAADGPATPKTNSARAKPAPTPKSSAKRAMPAKDIAEDHSPTKRAKKATPKAMKKESRNDDDEDDEEQDAVVVKVKKEEGAELNESAVGFYEQLNRSAYAFEHDD
ncbi:hypothetical protein ACEQ8H_003702 [Pleosporales sp. CAS-2024a]